MIPQSSPSIVTRFAAAAAQTLNCLQRLKPLLEEEQRALAGPEVARLQEVLRRKLEALAALELALRDSDALQRQAGYATGRAGAEALLREHPHPPLLDETWGQLAALADAVERLNAVNGSLTSQAQHHTRAALTILTGRESSAPSYDRRGHSGSGLDACSLGKA
jgi:flagellar biosynthesis/type III secretory pathway chaperone